jgi:hypothetical protein
LISSLILAVSTPLVAGAEPPSGSYLIPVGGEHALHLPGGVGSPTCETDAGVTVCFSGLLGADASGAVTGEAAAEYSGDVDGDLDAVFTGAMRGSAADTRLRLAMTLTGELSSDGVALEIESRGRWRCTPNQTSRGFDCSGRVRRCVFDGERHLGCEAEHSHLALGDSGGPWLLYLELATGANGGIGGTAAVILATGQVLDYALDGRYDARTDTAKLRLVGAGEAQGSELRLSKLSLADGAATGGELRYRIAGQRGETQLPAPTDPIGGEVFPGHGTCPRGGFCDTNADTGGLFGGGDDEAEPGTFADTIFFPILGGASRLR